MSSPKYPKFRVCQWLDTSEASMAKDQADIVYGVQTKRVPYGAWMHCHVDNKAILFKSHDGAAKYIETLRKPISL